MLTFENNMININIDSSLNIFYKLHMNIIKSTFLKCYFFISSSFPKLVAKGYCGKCEQHSAEIDNIKSTVVN
jgi:hypothetical protein